MLYKKIQQGNETCNKFKMQCITENREYEKNTYWHMFVKLCIVIKAQYTGAADLDLMPAGLKIQGMQTKVYSNYFTSIIIVTLGSI